MGNKKTLPTLQSAFLHQMKVTSKNGMKKVISKTGSYFMTILYLPLFPLSPLPFFKLSKLHKALKTIFN
ncbi:hypothetical protein BGP_1687 [Beggiatoa sp. PS]|nr:hypothetical protein BGP_1687 [Beggiatoa sp. PS]